jgi:hypothetical protein
LLAPRYSAWDWGAQIVSNGVTTSFGNVRWKLPVPLYMAPGDALQCMLDNDATYYAAALNVQVTYVGRIITQGAEAPEARAVPWVGWFEKLSDVPPVGSTDSWRNPFMHPLHVERLTCRVYDVRSVISTDIQATFDGMLPSEQFIGSTYMTIGLQDSLGYKIASCMGSTGQSVDTPIGAVFDPPRLAWTFQRPLAAREALEAVITNSDATIAGQLGQFGMVGYREEKT